ncbi:FG-GAP-like repeat-containing protein [Isosphaeraceae bacterium EP7]
MNRLKATRASIRSRARITPRLEALEPRTLLAAAILASVEVDLNLFYLRAPVAYEGSVYYFDSDGTSQTHSALYKSDGTPAGTHRLADLSYAFPTVFVESSGSLYFTASNEVQGNGLWKITGSAVPVKVNYPTSQPYNPNPINLTDVGGVLFFSEDDHLYKTDGTDAGSVLVSVLPTDFNRGLETPSNFKVVGPTLYFSFRDAVHGRELWKTDGTEAGTVMVKDINPGSNDSITGRVLSVSDWSAVGPTLYFYAGDGVHGDEVWKSDGTAAGTVLVKDINPGLSTSIFTPNFVEFAGAVYFTVDDGVDRFQLWKSDGTDAGTLLVKKFANGTLPGGSSPSTLIVANGSLLFTATGLDGTRQLWKTDGTDAGTLLVTRVTGLYPIIDLYSPILVDSTVYFVGVGAQGRHEIWKTDGTAAGTVLVKELDPVAGWQTTQIAYGYGGRGLDGSFTAIGSTVFFLASLGLDPTSHWKVTPLDLWKSDGTDAGTAPVMTNPFTTDPAKGVTLGRYTYFIEGPNANATELWRTDGTARGTNRVSARVTEITDLVVFNGALYFRGYNSSSGSELWTSDGHESGTHAVLDLNPGMASASPAWLTPGGDALYFTATAPLIGSQLYKTDGTAAGTTMVKAINAAGTTLSDLSFQQGRLIFSADDGVHGAEPWTSDGTAGGTALLMDVNPGAGSSDPSAFQSIGGLTVFVAVDGTHGRELWASDGTAAGTTLVADINPGAGDGLGLDARFVPMGGALYFAADDGVHGAELWKTDGTSAGTSMVIDLIAGASGSVPTSLTTVGGSLYFVASGAQGTELYKSDGTAAGTSLVKDINPGEVGSGPHDLLAVGEALYFVADDSVKGAEIWRTDGTEAGTSLFQEMSPQSDWPGPRILTSIGLNLLVAHEGNPWLVFEASAPNVATNDFDGDGRSDETVYDPTTSIWYVHDASGIAPTTFVWGRAGSNDIPLTGDFDGDGRADMAVYSPDTAIWAIHYSSGIAPTAVVWGRARSGDIPIVGDFDDDGKADLVAYSPSKSIWSIKLSSTPTPKVTVWGRAGSDDIPLVIDYDHDGLLDLAVFSPSTHRWYVGDSAGNVLRVKDMGSGAPTTLQPTIGDFDGDGRSDLALYDEETIRWRYLGKDQQMHEFGSFSDPFSYPNRRPKISITGDYDGNGRDDFYSYIPAGAQWLASSDFRDPLLTWGRAGSADVPMSRAVTPTVVATLAARSAAGESRSSAQSATDAGASLAALPATVAPVSATVRVSSSTPSFSARGRMLQAGSPRTSLTKQAAVHSPSTVGAALTFKRAAPDRSRSLVSPA